MLLAFLTWSMLSAARAEDVACPDAGTKVAVHLAQGKLPPPIAAGCLRVAVTGPDGADVVATMLKKVPALARTPERLEAIGPALDDWLAEHSVPEKTSRRARPILRQRGGAWSGRVALLDADAGLIDGVRVTESVLADPTLGEGELDRLARRLPDDSLRQAAGAALVDRRLEALDLGPLADEARAVAAAGGRFELPADRYPIRSVRFREALGEGPWLIEQHVLDDLFVVLPPNDQAEIELGRLLEVDVDGLSRPVSVCEEGAVFDPTPCVDEARVSLAGVLERAGSHAVPTPQPITGLGAALASGVTLRADVGEVSSEHTALVALHPVGPLILEGALGQAGPELEVRVLQPGDTLQVEIHHAGQTHRVHLDPADPGPFELVSQGGAGEPGLDGADGRNGIQGAAGRNAMCPHTRPEPGAVGGDGEPGEPGGNGGRGGAGGEVRVLVLCTGDEACARLRGFAEARIDARGGPGGPPGKGGAGGSPGRGGRGGRGESCQTGAASPVILLDAQDGPEGLAGTRGPDGSPGRPGPDGTVIITQAAPVDGD